MLMSCSTDITSPHPQQRAIWGTHARARMGGAGKRGSQCAAFPEVPTLPVHNPGYLPLGHTQVSPKTQQNTAEDNLTRLWHPQAMRMMTG